MNKVNERLIKRAAEIIFANEGSYSSVNADDNGALSVGKLQWHGTRALRLLKKIISALGEGASLGLITPELYGEIKSATSWSRRTVSTYEKLLLSELLSTDESHSVQDAQAEEDVAGYLSHAHSLGVEDERAMIFLADIENQGGGAASARIAKNAPDVSLDGLFVSAKADRVFSNYRPRRERVYALLTGHPYGEEAYDGTLYEVRRGDTLSAIAREFGCSVREIASENAIADPNRILVGAILRIPVKKSGGSPETSEMPDLPEASEKPASPAPPAEAEYTEHEVVRGDTLSALARAHGTTVSAILEANGTKYRAMTRDFIVVGWTLRIPRGNSDA
jgi:LysM repeat protein